MKTSKYTRFIALLIGSLIGGIFGWLLVMIFLWARDESRRRQIVSSSPPH
jgi:peptidoglycan biosynthesis protein MviN/MurJ (putative lipid II flippase)